MRRRIASSLVGYRTLNGLSPSDVTRSSRLYNSRIIWRTAHPAHFQTLAALRQPHHASARGGVSAWNEQTAPRKFINPNASPTEIAAIRHQRRKSQEKVPVVMQADTPEDTRDLLCFSSTKATVAAAQARAVGQLQVARGQGANRGGVFICRHLRPAPLVAGPLTESTDGQAATEQRRQAVLDLLVAAFDRLVGIARRHAGDVVEFTGDGMLIVAIRALWASTARAGAPRRHLRAVMRLRFAD